MGISRSTFDLFRLIVRPGGDLVACDVGIAAEKKFLDEDSHTEAVAAGADRSTTPNLRCRISLGTFESAVGSRKERVHETVKIDQSHITRSRARRSDHDIAGGQIGMEEIARFHIFYGGGQPIGPGGADSNGGLTTRRILACRLAAFVKIFPTHAVYILHDNGEGRIRAVRDVINQLEGRTAERIRGVLRSIGQALLGEDLRSLTSGVRGLPETFDSIFDIRLLVYGELHNSFAALFELGGILVAGNVKPPSAVDAATLTLKRFPANFGLAHRCLCLIRGSVDENERQIIIEQTRMWLVFSDRVGGRRRIVEQKTREFGLRLERATEVTLKGLLELTPDRQLVHAGQDVA